jgi:hypothetical protein
MHTTHKHHINAHTDTTHTHIHRHTHTHTHTPHPRTQMIQTHTDADRGQTRKMREKGSNHTRQKNIRNPHLPSAKMPTHTHTNTHTHTHITPTSKYKHTKKRANFCTKQKVHPDKQRTPGALGRPHALDGLFAVVGDARVQLVHIVLAPVLEFWQ